MSEIIQNETSHSRSCDTPRDFSVTEAHRNLVSVLVKPGFVIKEELTPEQCHLWHMVTGISGEAGELLDAVKKHVIYRKELDLANVVEELGDLEFYMEGVRQELGLSREYILGENYAKLNKRYGSLYSDKAAQERADKQDGQ